MRLTAIKLAGFKSFVDPTTFRAPTNLTGIVGPNGCGKSNIIDAVRWVMGEGSARVLRGEQMADVIFSGSTARKPVGTATVELLFDNSAGRVGGQYAGYNEISVKRQVSRDGISQYYLNGTRCRRKDITDLFLGTGLGSRSYSIIEQGMISQIVDARPEEIRAHLEEAAGISKYKERRRETERRIQHTRDNLDRLGDLRDEVSNHLARLKRQARAAERYKELKAERRALRARALALEWRELRAAVEAGRQALAERETALEGHVAEQRKAERALEELRADQGRASDRVNEAQGAVYEAGSEIARLEQAIQHARELDAGRRKEHEETGTALQDLEQHMVLDRAQMEDLARRLADVEPKLEEARGEEDQAAEETATIEQEVQAWQDRLERHHAAAAERQRAANELRARTERLEQRLSDTAERGEAVATELDQLGGGDDASDDGLEGSLETARAAESEADERLAEARAAREKAQAEARDAAGREHEARAELHAISGRLESLQAVRAALPGGEAAAAWLAERGIDDERRVAGTLTVSPEWQEAVEVVLGQWLEAVVVDDAGDLAADLAALREASLALISDQDPAPAPDGTLAAMVDGPAAVTALLASVHTAPDVDAARSRVSDLGDGESVICPEGLWLGPGWARSSRGGGVLVRERDIRQLSRWRDEREAALAEAEQARERAQAALGEAETALDEAQQAANAAHRERSEAASRLAANLQRADERDQRRGQLTEEQKRLADRQDADREALRAARSELETELGKMAELEEERREIDANRKDLLERRDAARQRLKAARERRHELALKAESGRASRDSLAAALKRMDSQFAQLQQRFMDLAEQLAREDDPEATHRERMEELLAERSTAEQRLGEARAEAERLESAYREQDQARQKAVRAAEEGRAELERARLGQQERELDARNLERQAAELEADLAALAGALDEDAEGAALSDELERLDARITRMEPVNLAAIGEYEEEQKRKEYLDAQNEDLVEALATLEAAIARIDRQTRTRFKDTFEQVNKGVQELFPRLFGGGHAYLEMTGEDLLSTGVAIMARPPGKRVSSIHLLSGGEKALTAVAFVFAIFRLNPAPFCMLDEVDAPLDDANVGRFSNLVREMSDNVQFIVVTHNKITMETVHQLSGVTMREPGVSRLVQVDIDAAAELAEA